MLVYQGLVSRLYKILQRTFTTTFAISKVSWIASTVEDTHIIDAEGIRVTLSSAAAFVVGCAWEKNIQEVCIVI